MKRKILKLTNFLFFLFLFLKGGAPVSFPTPPPMKSKVLKFSKNDLERLKERYTADPEFAKEPKVKFLSSNDALVGFLWRSITKARGLAPDAETSCGQAVNGRSRGPTATFPWNIPDYYFGCSNFYAFQKVKAGDLVSRSPAYAAKLARLAVDRVINADFIYSALCWIHQHNCSEIQLTFNTSADLGMTNWSKFPLYAADFGFGKPVKVVLPPAFWDSLVVIFPDESDGFEVYVGLQAEHMERFENDPETKL
jgi:shikimate O-hydroxycinnamoyltransferase